MLKDIGIKFIEPIIIHCDNTSTMSMSKNLVLNSKIKNISITYPFLREKAKNKEIILEYVSKKKQMEDIFIKPLAKDTFEYLRGILRVTPQSTSK